MGNWSVAGILITVGIFFAIFGFVLTQISVTNPYNTEVSIWSMVLEWIIP